MRELLPRAAGTGRARSLPFPLRCTHTPARCTAGLHRLHRHFLDELQKELLRKTRKLV
jgi:hypothetical protein